MRQYILGNIFSFQVVYLFRFLGAESPVQMLRALLFQPPSSMDSRRLDLLWHTFGARSDTDSHSAPYVMYSTSSPAWSLAVVLRYTNAQRVSIQIFTLCFAVRNCTTMHFIIDQFCWLLLRSRRVRRRSAADHLAGAGETWHVHYSIAGAVLSCGVLCLFRPLSSARIDRSENMHCKESVKFVVNKGLYKL